MGIITELLQNVELPRMVRVRQNFPASAVGDVAEEVRAELQKLGSYAHGAPVDAGMVKELSFDEGRNTMLKFLDAFCQARLMGQQNVKLVLQGVGQRVS